MLVTLLDASSRRIILEKLKKVPLLFVNDDDVLGRGHQFKVGGRQYRVD